MIHKHSAPSCGQVRVTFELPSCIWADRIFVAGDFNGWNSTVTPMRQSRDGVWRAVMDLPANRQFEFRYLIDGKWQTDHHADGSRPNEYGSENSIVDTSMLTVETLRDAGIGSALVRDTLPRLAARAARQPLTMPVRSGVQQAA